MFLRAARLVAALAIAGLLLFGLAATLTQEAQDRVDRALTQTTAQALADAAAITAALEKTAAAALSDAIAGRPSDIQALSADAAGAGLIVAGVASLVARDGAWTVRHSAAAAPFAPGAPAAAAAARFRLAAAAAAAAPGAPEPTPERAPSADQVGAAFITPSRGSKASLSNIQWLLTFAADRTQAALIAVTPAPVAAPAGLATQSSFVAAPTTRATVVRTDHARRVSFPAPGGVLETTISAARTTLKPDDFLAALQGRLAPALIATVLLGAAFLWYARRLERRAGEDRRDRARALREIDAKSRELEENRARFQHLAESTKLIPWTADLGRQRFTYLGPQIEALTGYPASAWRAAGFWAQHVHPKDRRRVMAAISDTAPGSYVSIDYRIRAANGATLHMRNMLSIDAKRAEGSEMAAESKPGKVARGFLMDVTEMKRAAAALEIARQRAEEANRIKSDFLANMSHELRTPLNAVIGFSEIMKDELFGPLDAQYREYAESVHASGRHLLDLINDVLDLSKIEAGRVDLAEEETDAAALLRECQLLLRERTESAGLFERSQIDDALPPLFIDPRRIKQVILNLLSNAIKFTPAGGSVTLGAEHKPGRGVRIWVRDTGVGMSAEDIPKALSKFGQVDSDLTRQHDGTGLGLPIARSLMEMHGGALRIRSAPGNGTEISLYLPEERIIGTAPALEKQSA